MDLFFVLNGFLVSGLLFAEQQKTGKIRIGRFLIRRGFKIYPSFYVFLLVTFVTSSLFKIPSEPSARGFTGEALFLQNYYASVWYHTWSLAVEEHFYLLLSLITYILVRNRPTEHNPFQFLQTIIGLLACIILVMRTWSSLQYPIGQWSSTLGYTHLRIDSLFFGVWLAYLYHFQIDVLKTQVTRHSFFLTTLGCCTMIVSLLFPLAIGRFMYSYGFTLLYLGFGGIILLSLLYPLRNKAIVLVCLAPLAPNRSQILFNLSLAYDGLFSFNKSVVSTRQSYRLLRSSELLLLR